MSPIHAGWRPRVRYLRWDALPQTQRAATIEALSRNGFRNRYWLERVRRAPMGGGCGAAVPIPPQFGEPPRAPDEWLYVRCSRRPDGNGFCCQHQDMALWGKWNGIHVRGGGDDHHA